MFSVVRRRMSYANVVATVAMVFAMTGGAYAASKVLITSTKQIKPSVLAQLKGKAGANGAPGATGPAGPTGAQGPAGANGKDGAPGANGTNGTPGEGVTSTAVAKGDATCREGGSKFTAGGKETFACNGAKGPEGNIKATLNPGATETGTFLALAVESEETFANVSFAIPLAQPGLGSKEEFFVTIEEVANRENATGSKEAPAQCPGTVGRPEAQEGNLCLYEGQESSPIGKVTSAIFIAESASGFGLGVGPVGSLVLFKTEGNTLVRVYGSWAVTAG